MKATRRASFLTVNKMKKNKEKNNKNNNQDKKADTIIRRNQRKKKEQKPIRILHQRKNRATIPRKLDAEQLKQMNGQIS